MPYLTVTSRKQTAGGLKLNALGRVAIRTQGSAAPLKLNLEH